MAPPEHDVDSIITAPPQVGAGMKHLDVWPGFGSSVDPSRVDRVQQALRVKVETSNSFDDPHRAVKKLFADADTDKNGTLGEDEFVKLMVGKLNFSGYPILHLTEYLLITFKYNWIKIIIIIKITIKLFTLIRLTWG